MTFVFIEGVVCDSVNNTLQSVKTERIAHVRACDVYRGSTKVSFSFTVARQFCYLVMHDIYHVSYSEIAKRAGHSMRSVMRCVKKARELLFVDDIYKTIHAAIKRQLKC